MLLQLQVVFVKFRLYCIVQFSLILCFIGVQMYILTPTIKLALSDVVFLRDESWRLVIVVVQHKKRSFVSPADCVMLLVYIYFYF